MNDGLPIFINSYNRLDCLKNLLGWFEKFDSPNITIIDNNSTYEPLLEFYEKTNHNVYRIGENYGPYSLWEKSDKSESGLYEKFELQDKFFILTDPDVVPIDECPTDIFEYFNEILVKNPNIEKIGLGLKLDDIPEHYPLRNKVLRTENQYWPMSIKTHYGGSEQNMEFEIYQGNEFQGDGEHRSKLFHAPLDTTFCMIRPGFKRHGWSPAETTLRSGYPYVARHLAWYMDGNNPTEEDKFYYDSRLSWLNDGNHW